jgi:hypothetical protein
VDQPIRRGQPVKFAVGSTTVGAAVGANVFVTVKTTFTELPPLKVANVPDGSQVAFSPSETH